jgi:hypothetical protein
MTIVQGQTTAFKVNILSGLENFAAGTPYTYKIALYTASATLNNATTTYASTSNEVVGTGYTAGGKMLTIANPPTGDTTNNVAWVSFNNATWNPASFTCRGALIYNSTTGAAVAVLDFGADKTATSTFVVTFPTAGSSTAIIRIS